MYFRGRADPNGVPTTPLFDPDAFFDGREADPLAPALIVLLVGATSVATGTPETLAGRPGLSPALVAAAVLLGAAVGGAAAWLLVAVAVHAVSALYGGAGGFRRTLSFVGWGFLPGLFSGLVAVAVAFGVAESPAGVGAAPVGALVSVAGTLWQGYVWAYAAMHARALDRAAGFATAAVPAVGMILFAVGPTLA